MGIIKRKFKEFGRNKYVKSFRDATIETYEQVGKDSKKIISKDGFFGSKKNKNKKAHAIRDAVYGKDSMFDKRKGRF